MQADSTVFTNMFTLLSPPSSAPWPVSLLLPRPESLRDMPKDLGESSPEPAPSSKSCGVSRVSACPHTNRKHYAKNMCSVCYHRFGRRKLAWNCEHTQRFNYSKGLCQPCYLRNYIRSRPKVDDLIDY